jgi:hypothetical protein
MTMSVLEPPRPTSAVPAGTAAPAAATATTAIVRTDPLARLGTVVKLSWWATAAILTFGLLGGLAVAASSHTDFMTGQTEHPYVGVGLALMALTLLVAVGVALPTAWASAWQAREVGRRVQPTTGVATGAP